MSLVTKTYGPCGSDHTLQQEITMLMHTIAMKNGQYTLSELGYLNMNTITYVEDHIEVKIFFAPELAVVAGKRFNGSKSQMINPNLNMFNGILFVGNLEDAVSYENIDLPKYKIAKDSLGRMAVRVKEKKDTEDAEVVVMRCNLSLVLAAIYQVNLDDPDFKVRIETIGGKGKHNDEEIVMSVGAKQEFPVRVTVEFNDDYATGYDSKAAVNYLLRKYQNSLVSKENRKSLGRKISEDAKDLKKKRDNRKNKNVSKFR